MTDRRRVRREPWNGRTLVSHARILTSRRGARASVVATVEPPLPGVSLYRRMTLHALAPGWLVDDGTGPTELRTLDDVLTWMAGYGLGAIRFEAERWTEAMG